MKLPRRLVTRLIIACALAPLAYLPPVLISAQNRSGTVEALSPASLRQWVSYLASDELEGRGTFSEGLGLAAAYIAEQLRNARVKPGGDAGSYFQRVTVLGVRSTNRSTLTVEVNGQTRVFADGEGVTFSRNVGGKRMFTLDGVEFVGYGLNLGSNHNDYNGRDVKGKAVVWMGGRGPRSADPAQTARFLRSRASIAIDEMGAAASLSPQQTAGFAPVQNAPAGRGGRGGQTPEFTTTQRLDAPQAPSITASDEFFEFLFSASGLKYAELKSKSELQEDLPPFTLSGVRLTFNLDADYQVISTQYTRNVVGIVEGTDPKLKDTYVAFGAHYDHEGYARGPQPPGTTDRIFNGADDDASGSAALIGLAHSFAQRPARRSLLFVWHAGEELGLQGSRYFADNPVVPLDRIVAQLNVDMIGRNRDNKETESNTVYTVGADRISTELHNTLIDANAGLPAPLTIDFEMNDATDPERIYYRSDHYSYAAKGIPVIFFFTGLHPDYHQVTDSADKINYEKMSRIAQLIFETGRRLAESDRAPARDFRGPRAGRGANGKLSVGN